MESSQVPESTQPGHPHDKSAEIAQQMLDQDPLVLIVNKIINDGITQRASDIIIEPLDEALRVRYRIDGILYKSLSMPRTMQEGIINRIKIMSILDISEHRLPQDGRFRMALPDKEVDFRVSIVPTSLGEKVVLRVLDKSTVILDINKLGFDERTVLLLKRNLAKPFGMIIVCGPTGSGKTTTLYSAIKQIDSIDRNIITVEDPVECQLFGINQVAVDESIGLTFGGALRSILRQDPDIIMVGEIRDFDAGDIAVKAALTGHLLLSTLHTISAPGAVVRLMNMGIEPFLVAASCLLIVSQVLARTLCPYCKEEYYPTREVLEQFKFYNVPIDEKTPLYRKHGCQSCNHTGYKGRVSLAESIEINSVLRDLISAGAAEKDIRQAAMNDGMIPLTENGFLLVKAGVTSIEEMLRVVSVE